MHSAIFFSKNKKRSFRTPVEQTSEHSHFFSFFPNIAVHFLFFTICFSQLFSFYIILLHTIFFYQSFIIPALLRFFLNFLSFIILLPPLQIFSSLKKILWEKSSIFDIKINLNLKYNKFLEGFHLFNFSLEFKIKKFNINFLTILFLE